MAMKAMALFSSAVRQGGGGAHSARGVGGCCVDVRCSLLLAPKPAASAVPPSCLWVNHCVSLIMDTISIFRRRRNMV